MTSYNKNDPKTIQAMFNSIATSYDRTNAALSFRMHHGWNAALVNKVSANAESCSLLDLCCGTGEIAYTFLKSPIKPKKIFLLDFSKDMLQCAQAKANRLPEAAHQDLSYIQADAQSIPLPSNSVGAVTIAYGIRNVKDPSLCIQEVFRVLQAGGTFGILELTRPSNPVLRFGHHIYLRTVLPVLGWCFSANQEAYEYLCNSIHTFVEPRELEKVLSKAGFQQITRYPLSGGVATILLAKKPA